MNIEIANRLQKLRKENGYSQEELADKLGISRQAVSKWERAESSPDTDNLIVLAKLYNISLDELLYDTESVDEIRERTIDKEADKKDSDGSTTLTDDEGQSMKIENGHIKCFDKDGKEVHMNKKQMAIRGLVDGSIVLITLAMYFVWSFCWNGWHVSWVLWVLMPAIMSITEVVFKKRITSFNFPCLITAIYLFLGMMYDLWHPYWILFIAIPVFYIIFGNIEKLTGKADEDDDDEDND